VSDIHNVHDTENKGEPAGEEKKDGGKRDTTQSLDDKKIHGSRPYRWDEKIDGPAIGLYDRIPERAMKVGPALFVMGNLYMDGWRPVKAILSANKKIQLWCFKAPHLFLRWQMNAGSAK
jgi:hypothetical protein